MPRVLQAVVFCAVLAAGAPLHAAPQQPGVPSLTLEQIRERLEQPAPRPLTPKVAPQLRPTFKSRIEERPFVPTLEEDLRKTFALTDVQRQYAEYASRCCGLDLGGLYKRLGKAWDEHKARSARAQVARELAEVEAAARARAR